MEEEPKERRVRKEVKAFVPEDVKTTPAEGFTIPFGTGKPLSDSPRIVETLTKYREDDETIIELHRFLFKAPGKAGIRKQHIRAFYGFDMTLPDSGATVENLKENYLSRLESRNTLDRLKDFATILGLERGGTKNEILERIVDFCCHPDPSTKPLPSKSSSSTGKKAKRARDDNDDDDDNEMSSDNVTPVKSATKKGSTPTTTVTGTTTTTVGSASKPNNPAAFALFSREEGPLLLKLYPYLGTRIVEKINILTNLWNALPDADKQRFEQQSKGGGLSTLTSLSPSVPVTSSSAKPKTTSSSAGKTTKSSDGKAAKKKKKTEKKTGSKKPSNTNDGDDEEEEEGNGGGDETESVDNEQKMEEEIEPTQVVTSTTKTATGVFDYVDDEETKERSVHKVRSPGHGSSSTTLSSSLSPRGEKKTHPPAVPSSATKSKSNEDDDEAQLSDF